MRRKLLRRTICFCLLCAVFLLSFSRIADLAVVGRTSTQGTRNIRVSSSHASTKDCFNSSSLPQSSVQTVGDAQGSCPSCLPALVVFSMVRADLLALFLASVDLVTEHVFVVCNFETQEKHAAIMTITEKFSNCSERDNSRCENPNIRNLQVLSSTENNGFSGSFNMALKAFLPYRFPYIVFNNDDVRFISGRLLAAKQIMESTEACMYYLEGFSSFGISAQGIANVGPMDENFWPAYGEDCDYWYRAQLNGCKLFYRGGSLPDRNVTKGNAFVIHGDSKHSSSITFKSSQALKELVANTLDGKRGRFAYLNRKWGLNACDLYHEVINSFRNENEVLDAMNQTQLESKGMRTKLPYGRLPDVNAWLKHDWQEDGSVSPRGINSRWAPNKTVWQDEDDEKINALAQYLARNRMRGATV